MFYGNTALIALIVTACGTDPNATGTNPNGTPATDKSSIQYQPADDTKEVTVEYRKDGESYALSVDDTKDMPACERTNNRQLVYVKNQDKFFACEDNWVEVNIRGEAGAAGKDGASVVGPKGDKGDPGADGKPVSPNQWYDPITEKTWLVGSLLAQGMIPVQPPCANGWRLGSLAETREAIHHGLALASAHLNGPVTFWTASFSADPTLADVRAYLDTTGLDHYNSATTFQAGAVCMQEVAQ